jgi:hypothetical protein
MRQPVMHSLPPLLRGTESSTQKWSLDPGEPFISVAVPLTLPSAADNAARFRFELLKAGKEPVWSAEMTAAQIREHLEVADLVNLAVVLPRALEAGPYEFRVVPSDSPGATPLYRTEIEVAYRQSPAETNAPQ